MRSTTSLRLLTVLAALAALLAIPATAFAYAPTGDDFITCVAGGDNNVECVAGIFQEGCTGTFEAVVDDGTVIDSGSTTDADADGEVSFDFDVPADQGDTEVTVTVDCGAKVLSDAIAMVEDGEVIANTGFDSMALLGIGVAALAIGGGVLAFSRRRRTSSDV